MQRNYFCGLYQTKAETKEEKENMTDTSFALINARQPIPQRPSFEERGYERADYASDDYKSDEYKRDEKDNKVRADNQNAPS